MSSACLQDTLLIQYPIVSLYISNEQVEFEMKTILFTLASKEMKTFRYKSNKTGRQSLQGKLKNSDEQNQRTK